MTAMIDETEYYSGDKGTSGQDAPKETWIARTGEGPANGPNDPGPDAPGHGKGMSYSYGGNHTIEDFNRDGNASVIKRGTVTGCNIGYSSKAKKLFYNNYGIDTANCAQCHGEFANIAQAQGTNNKIAWKELVDTPAAKSTYAGNVAHGQCATPTTGYQKYPGLLKAEYESKQSYNIVDIHTGQIVGTTSAFPQFDGTYWAGTDCSNLAQRIMLKAKTTLSGVTDIALTFNDQSDLWTESFRKEEIAFQAPLSKTSKQQKLLRRGDVIHYDTHMTIVHQEKPLCSDKNGSTKCTYEIVHAYGRDSYTDEDGISQFMRKVVKMPNQITYGSNKELMPAPTGFGRIKLWE